MKFESESTTFYYTVESKEENKIFHRFSTLAKNKKEADKKALNHATGWAAGKKFVLRDDKGRTLIER